MAMREGEKQARLHYAAIHYGHATGATIHRFDAVVRLGAYTPAPEDRHVPGECPLCGPALARANRAAAAAVAGNRRQA